MSNFIEKLEKLTLSSAPEPMGFRMTVERQKEHGMLLVGSLDSADSEGLSARMAGADAGLLNAVDIAAAADGIKRLHKALPDIPCGARLADASGSIQELVEAGGDFIVFPPTGIPLSPILEEKEMGRVLEVDSTLGEGLLRTLNGLPVDAVLLASEEYDHYILTWRHLMQFRRLANLSDRPLLVWAPPGVSSVELQELLEAGVKAVVVEAGKGETAGRLKEIQDMLAGLSAPPPRKKNKFGAVLPRISAEAGAVATEEEDGGEDEGEDE